MAPFKELRGVMEIHLRHGSIINMKMGRGDSQAGPETRPEFNSKERVGASYSASNLKFRSDLSQHIANRS